MVSVKIMHGFEHIKGIVACLRIRRGGGELRQKVQHLDVQLEWELEARGTDMEPAV